MLDLLTVAVAVLVAYFSIMLVAPTEIVIGPVRIEFALRPALAGRSVVELPPAGSLSTGTHLGPAEVAYTLKEISVEHVDEFTREDSPARQALKDWRDPVMAKAFSFMFRVVTVAAATAGAAAWLIQRRWRWLLGGAATGAAVALLLTGLVYATYDTGNFAEPVYSGNLTGAPGIIDFSQDVLANLEEYEDRVPMIAESLYRTVNELQRLPETVPEDETIRILHVSDLHSSEAGANLVRTVSGLYDVDFVIDTGDLTELGLPFESDYPGSYLPLPVPYIWIAGNHDNPLIAGRMKAIDNVVVLENGFVTIDGVTIGGFPDPSSSGFSVNPMTAMAIRENAAMVAGAVGSASPAPFIVAVHDPAQAASLPGRVPVVLSGHTHTPGISVDGGTVLLDCGSTGGGGLRSFEGGSETPNSLQVLYIRKDPMKLVKVDSIAIYGFRQEFTVQRRTFAAGEGEYGMAAGAGATAAPAP